MNLKGIFSRRSSGQLESDQPDTPQGRQQALPHASQDPVSGSSPAALVPAGSAPSASNSFAPAVSSAPAATSAQLEIKNLRVRYPGRDVDAVANVSLNLAPGQTLALLGDSGSGKSTLLRAVGGLVDVSGGDICYAGESVLQVPVHQRGFVLMFQDGQLFNNLSVAENVAYGVGRHSEKVVAQMLELVGMSAYANSPVTELSGGQAQRVALARALAPNPRLLLLDEPLSALDRSLREGLARDIRSILRERGTSAIYVTHDQDEAMRVADVVGIMAGGRLLRLDTPEGLWADPGGVQVARFLGFGPFLDADAVAALELPLKLEYGQILAPAPGAWSLAPADASLGDGVAQAGVESVTMSQGSYLIQASLEAAAADPLTLRTSEPLEVEQWINVRLDLSRCPLIDMRKRA